MSRSLRIEYENAWYHVMNRGARKMDIFNDDRERRLFLKLLDEIHNRYQVEIHAYCLMNNHYHLLIRTPLANLSKAMKHLNGLYVQRYNKMYKTDGPLFRGRFKSIIVDAENYLLRLSRYIHLNPVKGKLNSKAEAYKWSSCAAYFNDSKKPSWLQTNVVLANFGNKLQKQKYRLFLYDDNDSELCAFFDNVKHYPILGIDTFVTTITEKYLKDRKLSAEIPDQNILYKKQLIDLDNLMAIVAQYFQINIDKLKTARNRKNKRCRAITIYLAREITGQSLQFIANKLTGITYSRVSHIAHDIDMQLEQDVNLRNQINKIKKLLAI